MMRFPSPRPSHAHSDAGMRIQVNLLEKSDVCQLGLGQQRDIPVIARTSVTLREYGAVIIQPVPPIALSIRNARGAKPSTVKRNTRRGQM